MVMICVSLWYNAFTFFPSGNAVPHSLEVNEGDTILECRLMGSALFRFGEVYTQILFSEMHVN